MADVWAAHGFALEYFPQSAYLGGRGAVVYHHGAHYGWHHFVLGTHVCTFYATFDKAAEHIIALGVEEVIGKGVRVWNWSLQKQKKLKNILQMYG